MRFRQWTSILALIGVLVHAAALVRHHGVMLAAHLQYESLVSDLSVFCHGTNASAEAPVDVPHVPQPSDAQNGCPICSGQAPAVAVIGVGAAPPPPQFGAPEAWRETAEILPVGRHAVCPPARGPPVVPA